ncbi:hypothetical protein Tco_1443218, partial [Tanacetum coccineum]
VCKDRCENCTSLYLKGDGNARVAGIDHKILSLKHENKILVKSLRKRDGGYAETLSHGDKASSDFTTENKEALCGYCKNLKKTVKTGQTRTREQKSTQRAKRMLSKVNNGQLKSTFSQTWSTLNDKYPKNTKPVPQS